MKDQTKGKWSLFAISTYQTLSGQQQSCGKTCLCCLRRLQGYIMLLVAVTLLTISAATCQRLLNTLPFLQLDAYRYVIHILILVVALCLGESYVMPSKWLICWTLATCFFNNFSVLFSHLGLLFLPAGIFSAFYRVTAMTVLPIASRIIFKIPIRTIRVLSILINTGGIMLLLQANNSTSGETCSTEKCTTVEDLISASTSEPPLINEQNITTHFDTNNTYWYRGHDTFLGSVLTIIGALNGVGLIMVGKHKLEDVNPLVQILWNSATGLILSLVLMPLGAPPVFISELLNILMVLIFSMSSAIAEIPVTVSVRLVQPVVIGIVLSSQIALMFVVQHAFLGDIHHRTVSAMEILGVALIMFAAIGTPLYENIDSKCRREKIQDERNEEEESILP